MEPVSRRGFLRTAAGLFVAAAGVAYVPKVIYSFPSPEPMGLLKWVDDDTYAHNAFLARQGAQDAFEVHHRMFFNVGSVLVNSEGRRWQITQVETNGVCLVQELI